MAQVSNLKLRIVIVSLIIVCFMAILYSTQISAGPMTQLGVKTATAQQVSIDQIDHSTWDKLLKKYVDEKGFVDYQALKSSSADIKLLDGYLSHLSTASTTIKSSTQSQLAFWINAYNAVTAKAILDVYPTTSIRNHTAAVVGFNIWKDVKLLVGGQPYSLDEMEHKILRKMGEPRIHFAIVCASIGCPRLLNEAYTAEKLNAQLTTNAQAFFAQHDKFHVDVKSKTVHLSPILDWFKTDFGKTSSDVLKTIAPYVPENSRELVASGNLKISNLDYDWGLNDQKASK